MKKYIGTKLIHAERMTKDGIDGYKVIYSNPNNTKYESFSPKEVFEESYSELDKDIKETRELICEIFRKSNEYSGVFVPQQYVWIFLDIAEENGITFNKIKKENK